MAGKPMSCQYPFCECAEGELHEIVGLPLQEYGELIARLGPDVFVQKAECPIGPEYVEVERHPSWVVLRKEEPKMPPTTDATKTSYRDFPEERLRRIRAALEELGYEHRIFHGGKAVQYWHEDAEGVLDADSCIVPAPDQGEYFHDTPMRAPEAILSLIKFSGKPFLELGPLTKREEAYARLLEEGTPAAVRKEGWKGRMRELEKKDSASDHARIAALFAAGKLRWEPQTRELCFDGIRHSTELDEFGVPRLTGSLRARIATAERKA